MKQKASALARAHQLLQVLDALYGQRRDVQNVRIPLQVLLEVAQLDVALVLLVHGGSQSLELVRPELKATKKKPFFFLFSFLCFSRAKFLPIEITLWTLEVCLRFVSRYLSNCSSTKVKFFSYD